MPVNKQLLLDALEQTQRADKRGLWDQADYRREADCGTAGCFAYWTCVVGGRPNVRYDDVYGTAIRLLGLPPRPHELFKPDNSLDDLARIVTELVAGQE